MWLSLVFTLGNFFYWFKTKEAKLQSFLKVLLKIQSLIYINEMVYQNIETKVHNLEVLNLLK